MIFDVTDLEQPIMVKEWMGTTKASDHNLYVKGEPPLSVELHGGPSHSRHQRSKEPEGSRLPLDTSPGDNVPGFRGSWNNYPFFKNGAIGVVSIGEGFFMVKDRTRTFVP